MKLIPEREKFIELLGDLNDDIEKSMSALPPHLQEIHRFLVSSGFKINCNVSSKISLCRSSLDLIFQNEEQS